MNPGPRNYHKFAVREYIAGDQERRIRLVSSSCGWFRDSDERILPSSLCSLEGSARHMESFENPL